MDSLSVREFSQSIMNFTKQSPLPLEVKRLCLEEILIQIREETNQQLLVEIQQRDNEKKESESE